MARPLLLAAASIAAAFYSFLPTAYVGLSELGLIAGTGMIIAFLTTVTLLPALLAVLKPAGEAAPVGWAWLAPLDHFLDRARNWVVGLTLAAVVLGLPLLRGLQFDFNPLNLRSKTRVGLDPARSDARSGHEPQHHRYSGAQSRQRLSLADKLKQLPEVAKVRTLESFVPKDQDEKLAIIDDANFFFANTLNPDPSTRRQRRRKLWRRSTRRRPSFHRRGRSQNPGRRAGAPARERADRFGEGVACDPRGSGARAGYPAHDDARQVRDLFRPST